MLTRARRRIDAVPSDKISPAVSVLMPVRNGARFLEEALASLAAQTCDNFEIIAVDNGSSDGSATILATWARREPRLRILQVERPGISASLNFAAEHARAPLLARLDADDIALPSRLAIQVETMNRSTELGLLGSCAEMVDSRNCTIGVIDRPLDDPQLRTFLRSACAFVHSTVMMRRSVFRAVGGYRLGLGAAQDYDLWLRLAEITQMANLSERLVRYRVHAASRSARRPARQAIAAACISAACEARRRGEAEPFSNGVPILRAAVPLLGLSSVAVRNQIRMTSARTVVLQFFMAFPIPAGLKASLRALALRLGLHGLYLRALHFVLAVAWMSRSRQ